LQRALSLCKVGGLVLYSTCSLNPIEDEAVVTECMRRAGYDSLELVDIHQSCQGLKSRRGLAYWPVLCCKIYKRQMDNRENINKDDIFEEYKNVSERS